MPLTGSRTFVGFGFGPIQGALLLSEAFASGTFRRLVVGEIRPELVAPVRDGGGQFRINTAHADGITSHEVGPVEIYDVSVPDDRERLIEAMAEAEDIATAVTTVADFARPEPGGLGALIGEGLRRKAARGGPPAGIYAAENNNRAAAVLQAHVRNALGDGFETVRRTATFCETVIGKMCGVVSDPARMAEQALAPVTPSGNRAFLVEAYNRILVSRPELPDGTALEPGIAVMESKADLQPFMEAKLFGTNATQALGAYVGRLLGAGFMSELAGAAGLAAFLRTALVEESGAALSRKYAGLDERFTPEGAGRYADDLLPRVMNPHLRDTVARMGRDPERKLGWDDRLIGTVRLCLSQGIEARRYAFGAAAALAVLDEPAVGDASRCVRVLEDLWQGGPEKPALQANRTPGDAAERREVLALVGEATVRLKAWLDARRPPLDGWF